MLLCDRAAYGLILRQMPLGELVALYERTLTDYAPLAALIADELTARLAEEF